MVLAFIAIAGLLLSNKDNVISFINKHNINWFERNLMNSHQQQQIDKKLNAADENGAANAADIALNNERELNGNVGSPQSMVARGMGNVQAIAATAKPATKIITKPVIAITNPPVHDDNTIGATATAQYEPAWKSLIDKIAAANSNRKNDNFAAMNSEIGRNVEKAWSTVMDKIRATTTMSTPTTTTTTTTPSTTTTSVAPLLPKQQQQQPPIFIQQEIGKLICSLLLQFNKIEKRHCKLFGISHVCRAQWNLWYG